MLLHDLVQQHHAGPAASRLALSFGGSSISYRSLAGAIRSFARSLQRIDLRKGERVAIYLEKRPEFVVAAFGASAAGAAFVPVNPLLKAEQVAYILRDCAVKVLVTTKERLALLQPVMGDCNELAFIVVIGDGGTAAAAQKTVIRWVDTASEPDAEVPVRVIDEDLAAILYTSGSTGKPKGVVLTHRNMVAGAKSVAQYLENAEEDVLLAALPLSFDAGFSQLTTAFHVGARVVLLNYLLPRDVLNALESERVTGLTAVPPLWIQLAQLPWPSAAARSLRYIANTGGRMPRQTLDALREKLPAAKVYLMYGLTEAFRATYLPPEQVTRRPDSIGRAIPNAEILVLREDGTPCGPNEPGELVQRGALVARGYWNDPEKTAERFRPLPSGKPGVVLPEIAVFSGDTVRMDEEGFLYFIGRRDEMIKTSGYRVSPTEVEEVAYGTRRISECAAVGVPHPVFGQAIVLIVCAPEGVDVAVDDLLSSFRDALPPYMVPSRVVVRAGPLPRNANGKIDRRQLATELLEGGRRAAA